MQEIAKEIRGLDTGTIRIGTISSVSCHWLPTLIKQFQERYPNVEFVLHQGDYTEAFQSGCALGRRDFGFVNPDAIPNIKTRFVKAGEHRAVLPLNHPLAQAPYVDFGGFGKRTLFVVGGRTAQRAVGGLPSAGAGAFRPAPCPR